MTTEIKATLNPGDGYGSTGTFGDKLVVEDAKNRWFAIGCAPNGGRHVQGGPIDPNPYAFIYACAGVISSDGRGMAAFDNVPRLHVGDVVDITGYGLHTIEFDGMYGIVDKYNLRLVRCEDQ